MIRHHPGEDLLLAYAAGRLGGGQAIVVGAHLEACGACREQLEVLEALGGAMIERAEPQPLAAGALESTLRRIASEPAPARPTRSAAMHPSLAAVPPEGLSWPASLRGCTSTPWRWIGPGRRFARVVPRNDPAACLFLLSLDPGRSLPGHRHGQLELTQVLCGSFGDGRAVFGPGDFDSADGGVHHQPVVEPGGTCVCLTWVEGKLQFDGLVASTMARLLKV